MSYFPKQPSSETYYAGPSSSVPGASSGRGNPGPSSMAQQGQQPRPQHGINSQQIAMLQQMAQARGQQQGQNPQWTPHQLQLAMNAMQHSQGGNTQAQALIHAAMLANGGQGMGTGQQGQRPQDQPAQEGGGAQQGIGPAQAEAQAMQQQRIQQLIQQQGKPLSSQQLHALQGKMGTPSSSTAMRPPQQGGNIVPHLNFGSNPQPGQNSYGPPQSAPTTQLSLTSQQQQQFAAQRAHMMASLQFQQLQPQQQQQQLAILTQHMMRAFMMQNGQAQQQANQQQYSQPMVHSQGGTGPRQHQMQAQGQSLSSLPQKSALPRSASLASHRAPSPHPPSPAGHHTSSSPLQLYLGATSHLSNASSFSASNSSHQNQQHNASSQQITPPLNASSPTSQLQTGTHGRPTQPGGVYGFNGVSISNAQQQLNPQADLSTMKQHAQNAQTMLQNGQLTGGPSRGGLQNMTPQLQQQVAPTIGFVSGTVENHATVQNARSGVATRPPLPNINMSDFPFDWRLLAQINHLNDPKWRSEVKLRNPQLLAAVQSAAQAITAGSIPQDVLNRMQQVVFHAARSQAALRPLQQIQQQLGAGGISGFAQSEQQIQGLPIAQQQRLWAAQQAQGSTPQGYGGVRPPPPHLPPSVLPESPSTNTMPLVGRRMSASNDSPHERTPSQASMPPPAWIPSHTLSRPPPHTAPDGSSGPSPSPHAVPVKEWESAPRLDLPITDISPLPTQDIDETADPTFGGRLVPMSEKEKELVEGWLQRDKEFAKEMEEHKGKLQRKVSKWAASNDMETPWWQVRKGERHRSPQGRLSIIWPSDKANMRARSTHRGRKEIR